MDLWLNNPLRPLEASGTSGMKLPPNGGLNLSVLDGWWLEGYNGKNGWPIGAEITEGTPDFQNEVDAASLYHILETQIAPLYYAKPDGVLPTAWLQLMRESIRSVTPIYNTQRMVQEYSEKLYEPAALAHARLERDNALKAREVSQWKNRMRQLWPQVRVGEVRILNADPVAIRVGEALEVEARVHLGEVDRESVRVQVYVGETDDAQLIHPSGVDLNHAGQESNGDHLYRGAVTGGESGAYGFNVRVIPHPRGGIPTRWRRTASGGLILRRPFSLSISTWRRARCAGRRSCSKITAGPTSDDTTAPGGRTSACAAGFDAEAVAPLLGFLTPSAWNAARSARTGAPPCGAAFFPRRSSG